MSLSRLYFFLCGVGRGAGDRGRCGIAELVSRFSECKVRLSPSRNRLSTDPENTAMFGEQTAGEAVFSKHFSLLLLGFEWLSSRVLEE